MDRQVGLPFKVARDPVYSEIQIYPLEMLFIDTPVLQRLRWLSQLCGAQMAYPGASHTRFAHSLGVMHLAGLYASRLWPGDLKRFFVLRLAGLLHDVGHGPFSHQFDDVIFKASKQYRDHDDYRLLILKEVLPKVLMDRFEMTSNKHKDSIAENLRILVEDGEPSVESFEKLIDMIVSVYEGEKGGTPEFNAVQGVLGADRLDFLLRDVYYSGTVHFGRVPVDRLIRNSFVVEGKLSYHVKVVDDIYAVLFTRYLMYKNVYFHKVGRAADLMIQEILKLSDGLVIDYESILSDPYRFLELTDVGLLREIELKAKVKLEEAEGKEREVLAKLLNLIGLLKNRKLWKLLLERTVPIPDINPDIFAEIIEEKLLDFIVSFVRANIADMDNLAERLRVDTPFRLTLVHPREFRDTGVELYDPSTNKLYRFDDYIDETRYKIMLEAPLQLIRVYVTDDELREKLEGYSDVIAKAIDSWLRGEVVTRW